jgi:hypothetical protein
MADGDTKGAGHEQGETEGARAPRDERHARDYWGTDGHGPYSGHFQGYGRGGALDLGGGGLSPGARERTLGLDQKRLGVDGTEPGPPPAASDAAAEPPRDPEPPRERR